MTYKRSKIIIINLNTFIPYFSFCNSVWYYYINKLALAKCVLLEVSWNLPFLLCKKHSSYSVSNAKKVEMPAERLTISLAAYSFIQFVASDLVAGVLLLSPHNLPNTLNKFSHHSHLLN